MQCPIIKHSVIFGKNNLLVEFVNMFSNGFAIVFHLQNKF